MNAVAWILAVVAVAIVANTVLNAIRTYRGK
jgi:hypothetical protein